MSQTPFVNASNQNVLDITGKLRMRPLSNAAQQVQFFDDGGVNSVDIQAPSTVASTIYKLPAAAPTVAGLSLLSDTAGNMSWGNPIGSLACLDVSNVDISNQVIDPYTNSSQVSKAIGTCVEYTAFHDISNGTICVTEVSNNIVYAANPQTLLTNLEYERLIGVAIEDASAGSIIKILEEGYCTVRVDPYDDGLPDPSGSVPTINLDGTISGNTYATDQSGTYFRDNGGILGNYSNNQNSTITFDAGLGNTAYIDLEAGLLATNWVFEFGAGGGNPTGIMYDRLGFQTSNDGITYTNGTIQGFCRSTNANPPYGSGQSSTAPNGYIFPMEFNGNSPVDPAASNPPAGSSGTTIDLATFTVPGQLPPAGSQSRFLRFSFRSDNTGVFSGWNLLVKGTGNPLAGPTYPINSLLYLSVINLERASNILGGNIPIGYTVSENLGNTINQYVFARIHDR